MPTALRKAMCGDLNRACAKALMLHGSCEAMEQAGEKHSPGASWFEGTKVVCDEIARAINEALEVLEGEDEEAPEHDPGSQNSEA